MKKFLLIVGILLIFSAPVKAEEESERNTKAMGGFGLVADWRVKFLFNGGFYAGLNRSQYFWSAEDVRSETNTRNIPTSETSISDHRFVGILVGKSF